MRQQVHYTRYIRQKNTIYPQIQVRPIGAGYLVKPDIFWTFAWVAYISKNQFGVYGPRPNEEFAKIQFGTFYSLIGVFWNIARVSP